MLGSGRKMNAQREGDFGGSGGGGSGSGGGGSGTGSGSGSLQKSVSACDVAALRKCLEENKGDRAKCKGEIEAFRASCSSNRPQYDLSRRPIADSNIVTGL